MNSNTNLFPLPGLRFINIFEVIMRVHLSNNKKKNLSWKKNSEILGKFISC